MKAIQLDGMLDIRYMLSNTPTPPAASALSKLSCFSKSRIVRSRQLTLQILDLQYHTSHRFTIHFKGNSVHLGGVQVYDIGVRFPEV